MASPAEGHLKRIGKRLSKGRKPQIPPSSIQYPDRLAPGDDIHEDFARAQTNQSVFSLITVAGSKAGFHPKLDEDSSGSDTEHEESGPSASHVTSAEELPKEEDEDNRVPSEFVQASASTQDEPRRQQSKPLKSPLKSHPRDARERNYMSQSTILPPSEKPPGKGRRRLTNPRDAPFMSQILEAQAKVKSSAEAGDGAVKPSEGATEAKGGAQPPSLATRLMEIFGFSKPEEVVSGIYIYMPSLL
jgi:hypothetical protein